MASLRQAVLYLCRQRARGVKKPPEWSSVELAALGHATEDRAMATASRLVATGVLVETRRDDDGTRWYRPTTLKAVAEWRRTSTEGHIGGNCAEYRMRKLIKEKIDDRINGRSEGLKRADAGTLGQLAVVVVGEPVVHPTCLSVKELSIMTGVEEQTIARHCRIGKLAGIQVGKGCCWRIPMAEAEKYLGPGSIAKPVQRFHSLLEMTKEIINAT